MAAVKLELKRERRRSGPSVSAGRLRPATIDLIWGKSIKPGLLDDGMVDEYAFCLAAQTGEGEAIATVSQRVTLTGTIEDARPSEEPTPRPTPGVDDASVGPARRSGSSTGCTTGGIGNSGCHGGVFVGCGTTPPYRDCAARALRGCGGIGAGGPYRPCAETAQAARRASARRC